MKTAIYIEDGTVQLVLTPESDYEKNALSMFREKPLDAKVIAGSFYDCRGGWVKQVAYHTHDHMYGGTPKDDESLILRIDDSEPTP